LSIALSLFGLIKGIYRINLIGAISEEVSEFIYENYSNYEELVTFILFDEYKASDFLFGDSEKDRILLVQEDRIYFLNITLEFKFKFSIYELFLDDIHIEEKYEIPKEDLNISRRTYQGIETCELDFNSEELNIAFGDSYPKFVQNIIDNELDIIDRKEFESRVELDSWNKGEKDKLAKSLDDKLRALHLENSNYYLSRCSNRSPEFIIADGKYLSILKIDSDNHEIEEIDYYYLLDLHQSDRNDVIYYNKIESDDLAIKLCFSDIEVKKEFKDELKAELNSSDVYFYKGYWDSEENIEEIKKADLGIKNNFQDHTPYEFEEFIKELFEEKGYESQLTQKSADYGIDVIAEKNSEKIAIQVKRYQKSNKVGSPAVRKTLGSKHRVKADKTILITTSGFTSNAIETGEDAPIELWDSSKLHEEVEDTFL
jgi:HJR/Mrr/RecB family endonuclease